MDFPFPETKELIDVWRSGQLNLPKVLRWGWYVENGTARPQNCLQHQYSISILATLFLQKFRHYVTLDQTLFLTAVLVHDHGEGETKAEEGKDTLYFNKTLEGDLAEYLAFVERYKKLGKDFLRYYKRAFLLQFSRKDPECFPLEARQIMSELRRTHKHEILAFEAIERWDYLLYAIEQYVERDDSKPLLSVCSNNLVRLNELAVELPGFREEVWTSKMQKWLESWFEQNCHKQYQPESQNTLKAL